MNSDDLELETETEPEEVIIDDEEQEIIDRRFCKTCERRKVVRYSSANKNPKEKKKIMAFCAYCSRKSEKMK